MDGKRCLIPPEIGEQILALDASKIVINFKDDDNREEVPQQEQGVSISVSEKTPDGQDAATKPADQDHVPL
jgi:hypothetical protein